jgi:FlaA1/EpsC-like NDP-sugar epimerase
MSFSRKGESGRSSGFPLKTCGEGSIFNVIARPPKAGGSNQRIKKGVSMKVLVTGGAGFIGSEFVRQGVQKKHQS